MRPTFFLFSLVLLAGCASPAAKQGLAFEVTNTGSATAHVVVDITGAPGTSLDVAPGATQQQPFATSASNVTVTIHVTAPSGASGEAHTSLLPCDGRSVAVFEVSGGPASVSVTSKTNRCDR